MKEAVVGAGDGGGGGGMAGCFLHSTSHHLLAGAIVVKGDSGHRVVMSVTMGGDSACDRGGAGRGELKSRRTEVELLPQSVLGVPANGIAKLMAPKPALCGQDIEVTFDALAFVGHPIALDQRAYSEGSTGQESQSLWGSKQLSQTRHERLTTFTFVLVVHLGCKSLNHWKEVARSAGLVWVHEQLRSGYLSMEVQRIQDLVQGNMSSQERAAKEAEAKQEAKSSADVAPRCLQVEQEGQMSSLVSEVVEERWSKGRVVESVSKASIYLIAPEVNLATVGVSEREAENIAESFDRFMPAEEAARKGEEGKGGEGKGGEERARNLRRKSSRVSRGWRGQGSPKLRLQKALQVFSQGKTLEALQHDIEIQTLAGSA
eukprot:751567-Hanusia_phi.AAC.1